MPKSIYSSQYRTFLSLLRQTREEAGVTQVDLARKLRITQSAVSKCERGERRLDIIELRRWCRVIGCSLPEFVTELEGLLKN